MIAAALFGSLILLSYLTFMVNVVWSVGVRGLTEIFVKLPARRSDAAVPAA